MNRTYQYYVEGPDDKKVVEVLKRDFKCIASGKVEVFNVVQRAISKTRIRALNTGVIVVLIYDTDNPHSQILENNIQTLKKDSRIHKVLCIPQVDNLEDELVRACNINSVTELTKSKTKAGFKKDILRCNNLEQRLRSCDFKIDQFWNKIPDNCFGRIGNDAVHLKRKMK